MTVSMTRAEFEEAVGDALDSIPGSFLDRLDNLVILVEDEPPPGQPLLGLYVGVPLPQRTDGYAYGSLPDRVLIFQGPLQRMSRSREELRAQIRVTVLHEIGHYFGIDDEQLHELGWG